MNDVILIIVIFFVVLLCICMVYLIFQRKIIPWTGGVCVLTPDGRLAAIAGKVLYLEEAEAVEGLFLPGAYRYNLPWVEVVSVQSQGEKNFIDKYIVNYHRVEKDNGIYILFDKVLDGSLVWCFELNIISSHPSNGSEKLDDGSYQRRCWVAFKNSES